MGYKTIWDGMGCPKEGDFVLSHTASDDKWRSYQVASVGVSRHQSGAYGAWRIQINFKCGNARLLDDIKPLDWKGTP